MLDVEWVGSNFYKWKQKKNKAEKKIKAVRTNAMNDRNRVPDAIRRCPEYPVPISRNYVNGGCNNNLF